VRVNGLIRTAALDVRSTDCGQSKQFLRHVHRQQVVSRNNLILLIEDVDRPADLAFSLSRTLCDSTNCVAIRKRLSMSY